MRKSEDNTMVEQTIRGGGGAPVQEPLKSISEQILAAGGDLKDKAGEFAGASADMLRGQASEFVDAAKDVASQATDRLKDAVSEKRGAGADYVGNLADTIRRAAREFDQDLPIAGTYIRKAASQVEYVSDSVRTGDFSDILRNTQSFARRQPTAFLGLAALAGFAVVRFLKSSSKASEVSRPGTSAPASGTADTTGYRDDFTT
jgi:uncharacterized protein YjbJ (UPF0337 family)